MGYCVYLLAILAVSSSMLGSESKRFSKFRKRNAAVPLSVNTASSHHEIDQKFLSISLGARLCTRLNSFKTTNSTLQNLAKGLAPLVGRVGGTYGGFIIFTPDSGEAVPADVISEWESYFGADFETGTVGKKNWFNKYCTGDSITEIGTFYQTVGWDLSLQMNHLLRKNGAWDVTNARYMLQHLKANNIQLDEIQLTNEPNSYNVKFGVPVATADQIAADFATLRALLNEEGFENTKIVGPDTTSLVNSGGARSFMNNILGDGLDNTVDAISFHHFFMTKSQATIDKFTDVATYDRAVTMMEYANYYKNVNGATNPIYVTETASCSSGGALDLSNRYAGALSWIDSLGVVAKYKGSRMNRQTFWSGNYALIDFRTYEPTPSYWTSVIFKRLIEGKVLNVTAPPQNTLRVYANCARTSGTLYGAVPGDIVLYYVNLADAPVTVSISDYASNDYNLFLFSKESLTDNRIYLNGDSNPLALEGDDLPEINPATQTGGSITIAAHGIGFVHVKDAGVSVCSS